MRLLLLPVIAFAAGWVWLDTVAGAAEPPTAKSSPAPSKSISDEIAFLLIGLITASMDRPTVNAIDTYAAAFHWVKNPPEINALLNAKVGYHGRINGQKVVLGGDGTNDIIGVMISQGFDPARVVAALRQAFTLKLADKEEEAGQRFDYYYLLEHDKSIGMVFVTYGLADAIRGAGSVSFMSMKKAHEAIGK